MDVTLTVKRRLDGRLTLRVMAAYAPDMGGMLVTIGLSLIATTALVGQGYVDPTGISREGGTVVPAEEYPVFDRVVESKFLAASTRVVLIERQTATRVHPDLADPPTLQWFEEMQPFGGRLRPQLLRDFIAKNQQPSRLEDRFRFGVAVRFVTPEGLAEPDVRAPRRPKCERAGPLPTAWPAASPVIDRLAFSRVGFTLKTDEALVYVANERPDATGSGMLVWLGRRGLAWEILDTDVLWVARPDREEMSPRE